MHVDLPPYLEEFLRESVAMGRFDSPSDAISVGLALLMEFDEDSVELRIAAQEGLESLRQHGPIDGEAAMARIRSRIENRARPKS